MLLFGVSALTCQTGRESAGSGTNVVVPGLPSGFPHASSKAAEKEVRNRGPLSTFSLQASILQTVSSMQSPG